MEKIKIVHFVCGLKSGGVEQVLYNYISKMDEEKYENYIVYQHEPVTVCYEKLASVCEKLIKIPSKSKRPFSNIIKSYKILKNIKPDIAHAHMNQYNFFPLLAAKFAKIKIRINHSHCAIVNCNIIKKIYYKICQFFNKCFATNYIACGDAAAKSIIKKKNVEVPILYNKIDDKKFEFNLDNRLEKRTLLNVKNEEVLIGCVGRLEKVKNHLRLIDIFKKVRDIKDNYKLIIVGEGSLFEELSQKIRNYKLEGTVTIKPPVDDINKYYSAFDCFILPSLYEGLPLTSIEAQFNGVPTILSTTVDKSAKVSECVDFYSLDMSDEEWANFIIGKTEKGRINNLSKELFEKYALSESRNLLEKLYCDMMGEANE